jgi:nucleoside-diphosphate-sugar epimerase
MRVLVAGGTGAVGRRLVPQLVAHGHQVTATTQNSANTDKLRAMGATPVVLGALDAAAVGEAVAHAAPDAIIHELTALSGAADMRHFDRWFAMTNRLRTEGTSNLLAAARATGVKRFVAQSYTGWNNARTGGPVKTEADALDPDPVPQQRESLAAIRFLEQAVTTAPLEGLVLRYGNLYGPGSTDALVPLLRKRMLPIIGGGHGVWSWTHIDDAASGAVAALERGAPGIYNIVDDEPAEVAEWLPVLAESVGAKPPMRIPAWLGRVLAGDVAVRFMTEGRGASNAKAKADLGWRPIWPTWRDGFRNGLGEATPAPASGSDEARRHAA